ncbi:DUF418 domain-containing protein [Massilia sp. PAMC28688]|uniref:DUF418 domain-containing protein n=1 Tax=Massilia sp. PAMC28688 TaxID=2861283 RepID=UPI001C634357|nr:DUF418 domain-containing protein [Massilia sp. PAMC28688]QYF92947.1 DUF418 domain-containing protein [Massilia sp. PAMC28688]
MKAQRVARIDALRGLAVFGIMLVNIWGFVYGFDLISAPVMGEVLGEADKAAVFFSAAFAEQKFYPIFSFLFGAGFALQTGGARRPGPALEAIRATYRRRLLWLLVCGLAHATLLWFGDILVAYALTGFWLATKIGARPAALVRSFKILVAVNMGIIAFTLSWVSLLPELFPGVFDQAPQDLIKAYTIYTGGSWEAVTLQRLNDYLISVAGYVFVLPVLALLFMLGVLAVRLGWLHRPERHREQWRNVLWVGLAIGVPINLAWGIITLDSVLAAGPSASYFPASVAVSVAGPALGAAYVAMFMLSGPGVARILQPVGRMALTNYLMQSLLLMLLLQGVGLGWGAVLSRAGLLGVAAAIMLFQLWFSHWWLARHAQGPMETLWRRYTYRR